MNDIFCTYFDHNYLSRALLMIRSLRRFEPQTPIHILALSELCESILREMALPNVEIIPLAVLEMEYPELAAIKPTRSTIEYYFTLSPFLPHFLFAHTTADRITYIDGDLYFLTSPRSILDELRDASVAVTPHRFSFEFRNHHVFGRFNVGWVTYRRCAEGLECVNAYKAECTAWCYDRVEDGRFGDQKYLDAWPGRYRSLKIIEHKGFNLANWNIHNYMIRLKNDVVVIDDDPLIFFHFASTQIRPDGSAEALVTHRGGRSKAVLFDHVVNPYLRALEAETRSLRERFPALRAAVSDIRYPPAVAQSSGG
ncbi:MAG: hypothetical protein ACTHJS_00225 [Xanthobacteraceae bacterium]